MCLHLRYEHDLETEKLKASKKPIRVYKILRKHGQGLRSPYRNAKWEPGKTKVSNRTYLKNPAQLTKQEIHTEEVNKGLHFYRTRQAARNRRYGSSEEIWTVEIQPKDIIAVANIEIAAHRAKLVKKIW